MVSASRSAPSVSRPLSQEDVDPSETPRKRRFDPHRTPRTSSIRASQKRPAQKPVDLLASGFTSTYLRRVPELQELGLRIVLAEKKRRDKDERQKEKERARLGAKAANSSSVTVGVARNSSATLKSVPPKTKVEDPPHVIVKRLFDWSIRELFIEGSIVIGDGTGRSWEASGSGDADNSCFSCWKDVTNTTNTSIASTSSALTDSQRETFISSSLEQQDPNEDSYVPVSPALLAPYVVKEMNRMLGTARGTRGVLPQDVTERLKRADCRWDHIGEWHILEALKLVEGIDGGVWRVGGGKWGLML